MASLSEEVFVDEEPESTRERLIPLSDVGGRPKISLQQVSASLAKNLSCSSRISVIMQREIKTRGYKTSLMVLATPLTR